ncbi:MAG: cytochrome bc complex cytochrome b subunit [Campylobacteraceae bacterium]|jgi:ubiquinol-cytochrome c reductase cytochrome b subunit|nr:cytochrome bc complex cytochrome b subunit [Campylobacteraceae bacterium]
MAHIRKATGFIDWLDQRLAIKPLLKVLMTEYWIPKNINFLWAMGVVLLVLFAVLFISGLFLLMYYKPDVKLAFDSVNLTIMQEVAYGWLWRHLHAIAASLIFLIIYIHMFVAIYYGSYKGGREIIWLSGMLLFVCFSAEAFSGYMLPWGQMSYWAAKVITELFANVPFIGDDLVVWIRGNFYPADATLTRFFMLHVVLLPIVIIAIIALHFYSLRIPHVNNQTAEEFDFNEEADKYKYGSKKESKVIPFWPAFLSKDFFVISIFMIFVSYLVCFHFDFAMDPINFDPADNLKTPTHIYPEWYFLWSYEVLRGFYFDIAGIPAMYIGLIAFGFAQIAFFLLPFLDRDPQVKPASKRPLFKIWFWVLIVDLILLTIYGKLPPGNDIYSIIVSNNAAGFIITILFIVLFIALPFITIIERKKDGGAK